jgi:cytochrome c
MVMRRLIVSGLTVLLVVFLAGNVLAMTPEEECIAKCTAAAHFVKEKGLDAAIAMINKIDGPFVSKNTFVILFRLDGVVLAHPLKPWSRGVSRLEDKDSAGKAYYKEYVEVAKTKGSGWVEHMWTSPDNQEFKKRTYVLRVEGKDLAVAAGYFPGSTAK